MKIYDNVLNAIIKKNRIMRLFVVLLGSLILALVYNCFTVPNNLVYGGMGGLAIIVNKIFEMKITLFLNISTFGLIFISFFILGFKNTSYTLVGYSCYILMINLTSNLSNVVNIQFDSFLLSIFIGAIIYGFGGGLVYRMGFNTGGADSIISIMQHYFKLPTAALSNIINGIIIVLGASVFGIEKTLYSIVFLKVSNFVSDRVILGSSESKICYIKTKHNKEIERYITDELHSSFTLLESTNGIGILKKHIIFCVIPVDIYYDFRRYVMNVDKKAMFISHNCYTFEGGTNHLFPV